MLNILSIIYLTFTLFSCETSHSDSCILCNMKLLILISMKSETIPKMEFPGVLQSSFQNTFW